VTDEQFEAVFELAERAVLALEQVALTLTAIHLAAAGPDEPCAHPVEERRDLGSTMGHERWACKVCGYEVTG
jgi:hypothetical protein